MSAQPHAQTCVPIMSDRSRWRRLETAHSTAIGLATVMARQNRLGNAGLTLSNSHTWMQCLVYPTQGLRSLELGQCWQAVGSHLKGDRDDLHVLLVQHRGQRAHEFAHVHNQAPRLLTLRLHHAAAARDRIGGRHHAWDTLLHARLQDSLPRLRPQQRQVLCTASTNDMDNRVCSCDDLFPAMQWLIVSSATERWSCTLSAARCPSLDSGDMTTYC